MHIKAQLYDFIVSSDFLDKYTAVYKEPLMAHLGLNSKLKHFSWGLLYIHLRQLCTKNSEVPPIEEAASFELLGLATELLDDILDGDNPAINRITPQDFLFFYTEILLRASYTLGAQEGDSKGLHLIEGALKGEWADTHRTVSPGITEAYYFDHTVKKSTAFFKFIAYHAARHSNRFTELEEVMECIAQITQIANDLKGIYCTEKKDIETLAPTLPLIKYIERDPEAHYGLLLSFHSKNIPYDTLIESIEASGAIDYCVYIMNTYKRHLIELIDTHFSRAAMSPLLTHLNMENLYETR